jgi:hypothetical protein
MRLFGRIITSEICVTNKKRGIALAMAAALAVGLFISCLIPSASFAQSQGDFTIQDQPQAPSGKHVESEMDKRLREALIKDDAKRNIAEATELLALATDLQSELSKEGAQYVSARAANETKKIEKLAKNIRGRLSKDVRDVHF